MTGFGSGRGESGGEIVAVELRSVNGKFCDLRAHLPRELSSLEPELSRAIKARVHRGVVDAAVRRELQPGGARGPLPRVDLALAAAYTRSLRELKAELGLSGEPSIQDLAGLEGVLVLAEEAPDLSAASAALQSAVSIALDALEAMRRQEGTALLRDLNARLEAIDRWAAAIGALAPQSVEAYRDRLGARVAEVSRDAPVDPQRLAQEVAFFAERSDISEELTRLHSHVAQIRALLAGEGPVGRKLEFLAQEVNREVNTIGSKAQHAQIAAHVVEIKSELERFREQIANVE